MILGLSVTLSKRVGGLVNLLQLFQSWFLKTGVVDLAGTWVDQANWTQAQFLAAGTVDLSGTWDDTQIW